MEKTKIMKRSRCVNQKAEIFVNDGKQVQIDSFKYLGSSIFSDERFTSNVKSKTAQTKGAFFMKRFLLASRNVLSWRLGRNS